MTRWLNALAHGFPGRVALCVIVSAAANNPTQAASVALSLYWLTAPARWRS